MNQPEPERKIVPGMSVCGDVLIVDVPEILKACGLPDTPENRDLCAAETQQLLAQKFPQMEIRCRNCGGKIRFDGRLEDAPLCPHCRRRRWHAAAQRVPVN